MLGRIAGMLERHRIEILTKNKNKMTGMDVRFADSFFSSFKRMVNRGRWYWRAWDFIRHDFPAFIKTFWVFRKALWNYRWYAGHSAVFPFMKIALMDMAAKIDERGVEVEVTRSKKVMKMWRTAKLLEHFVEDNFLELAEAELGELISGELEFIPTENGNYMLKDNISEADRKHNSLIYERARLIEEEMWNELWQILKGRPYGEFAVFADKSGADDAWDRWYDGSDIRNWWD